MVQFYALGSQNPSSVLWIISGDPCALMHSRKSMFGKGSVDFTLDYFAFMSLLCKGS